MIRNWFKQQLFLMLSIGQCFFLLSFVKEFFNVFTEKIGLHRFINVIVWSDQSIVFTSERES